MTTSSGTKANYHHGDLHSVLIETAAAIIRNEGESALSMRRLAAETGVSRTAPYHHFKDKHELLCAIAEEGFHRFDAHMESLGDNALLEDYLRHYVRFYVDFATQQSEYYDLMFGSQLWKSEHVTDSLRASSHATFRKFVDRVTANCEDMDLPDAVAPLRFAQVSWSTLHGLSRLVIDGIYVDHNATDAICEAIVALQARHLKSP